MTELPFKKRPFIIGMIHLKPLLGSPGYSGLNSVVDLAIRDLKNLQEGGVDGVMIENFWDVPYFKDPSSNPETVASFARVICEIKKKASVPVGVNMLRNGCNGALSLAEAFELEFIRVNVLNEAYITDQGIIEGCAPYLMRLRTYLRSKVAVLADVHVKHSYPMLQRPAEESAIDAEERGMADAIIITGSRTGNPPSPEEVKNVREKVKVPVLVGSGLTPDNAKELLKYADGAIVGTYFKEKGKVENPVDPERVKKLIGIIS
ncbi:MAG: BtpA/SgcQ family protein [Nitrososphaeria archaeon]|jgi:membrane complex biogenesis BtpA family protein